MTGTGPLRFVDFDIDCKADTYVEAKELARAVRAFIKDFSDATIEAVLLNGEQDEYEEPRQGTGDGKHVSSLDVTIQYTET